MAALLLLGLLAAPSAPTTIDLSGDWRFQLDPADRGIVEAWQTLPLPDSVKLPGSTDEQGIGTPAETMQMGKLTRSHSYVGAAWYQHDVFIPEAWAGQHVELRLERAHWETQLWVDDQYVGMENSLCVPHIYDLSRQLRPGAHRITLRVDNTIKINVCHSHNGPQWAHSVTDETQTNWNGVIGTMTLEAWPQVWVQQAQVYPDIEQRQVVVKVTLGNGTGATASGQLKLTANCQGNGLTPVNTAFDFDAPETTVETILPLGDDARLWDEFDPNVYTLAVTCESGAGHDSFTTTFGLRDFRTEGQHFTLNGRRVHLRGNLECCVFPHTGYPPMDAAEWRRLLTIARDYGLNHLRFHSWCPPEAAFVAADELGFFLQIEAPVWDGYGNIGNDTERANYIAAEADRIVDTYGNHPSFCLMSMGNELGQAKELYLRYLVEHLRERDPRHFYTCTTHPAGWDRNDDYFSAAGGVRGTVTPDSTHDYRATLEGKDRPLIAHEIGQYAVFPDFTMQTDYTGHLKASYFDVFRRNFEKNIGLEHNAAYASASGALSALLYKEEIEAQLRTPNLAGFQLLGLQDFPGQGVALIGMLDAFWKSKGIVTPEEWRAFCGPTVALARMPQRTWTTDQTFEAVVEVRHHGPEDLKKSVWNYSVEGTDGGSLAGGGFAFCDAPTGSLTRLGTVRAPLSGLHKAREFVLRVSEASGLAANEWRFWVYPAETSARETGVLTVTEWGDEAKEALAQGRRVLLMPRPKSLAHKAALRFFPVFWCNQLFGGQPDHMGIVVNPAHPVFADFPTRSHSDWQWHDVLQNAESVVLDDAPRDLEALVQVVPDFNECHRLSPLWEARVGEGRLMVCTLNLRNPENSPARRQFLRSLHAYLDSPAFAPQTDLTTDDLDQLLEPLPKHALANAPEHLEHTVLHVQAARSAETSQPDPWVTELDKVITESEGFGYEVNGAVWRDAQGAAWHGRELTLHTTCPKGFTGALYVHFHDWNSQNRVARLFFDGRDRGSLMDYAEGEWLRFPITAEMTEKGYVELVCQTQAGPNVMVTELALLPGE